MEGGSKIYRLVSGDTWTRGTAAKSKDGIDHVDIVGAVNVSWTANNVFDKDGVQITAAITEDLEDYRFEANIISLTVNSGTGTVKLVKA